MLPNWYFDVFNRYAKTLQSKNALYLALSAGVDSNTLLHWLYTFKDQLPPIYTIHVNHNWHDQYSHLWANFARKRAKYYGFEHYHYEVYFEEHDPRGLEAAGREARYLKFGETMQENSLLCVGHHRSDQAETLMQRLLRSAGVRGLGAMRDFNSVNFGPHKIDLFRPFLSISKQSLYETATHLNLPWMEDYTNHEADDMERNIIRNNLFKEMGQVFPNYEAAFYQVTQFMQEADDLLVEVAAEDLKKISIKHQEAIVNDSRSLINLPALKQLSALRQKNAIQAWIRPYNLIFTQKQMREFFRVFIAQVPTHQTCFKLDDFGIFYFQDTLYLRPLIPTNSEPSFRFITQKSAPAQSAWDQYELMLVPRKGGERFHPLGRDKRQTLKKLLQAANLPQWQRDDCWLLQDKNSGEILWVNHLGFSKILAPFIQDEGFAPEIVSPASPTHI